jgi:glucose-6-phosphate 1-dehydrogenase
MAVTADTLLLFGATGDLSQRMLLPSLFALHADRLLPPDLAILGTARSDISNEGFRNLADSALAKHLPADRHRAGSSADFLRRLRYVTLDASHPESFSRLSKTFGNGGTESLAILLSTAPSLFQPTIAGLQSVGLTGEKARIALEKPLGHDLPSFRTINDAVSAAFPEERTFRIDHYLGKETVQNLLALRFGNRLFEPLWNASGIEHIQIMVSETVGLEGRGGFYDNAGALRDMVQNHMLQVLSIVAMEPPYSLDADVIRDAKAAVLHCLRPLTPDDVEKSVVRAQYIDGDEHGQPVPGYRYEVRKYFEEVAHKPIPPESVNSTTETFVALRLFIDNWRWAGVPFYLRTGKRLPKRASEVAIQFKEVPQVLFNASPDVPLEPTVLSVRVQPEEGLAMRIACKLPGPKVRIYPVKMEFNYSSSFGGQSPEAYERLILDVMAGDATLFMRRDAVEAAWQFVTPVLDSWAHSRARYLPEYKAGTWGPLEADRLIEADGRQWRTL